MSFFSSKQKIGLEDFCRNFYDKFILSPSISTLELDVNAAFAEVLKTQIAEVYPEFIGMDIQKFKEQIIILRFELFALAWTHKFISGKPVVIQSVFTKRYLKEKGRIDIWNGMEPYNKIIDGAILHWLTSLGKFNLSSNYHMRDGLAAQNIKDANELSVAMDESIERINNRIWSEHAWKQKLILGPLAVTLWNQLGFNSNELGEEAEFRIQVAIKGLYDGAQQSWDDVKIVI